MEGAFGQQQPLHIEVENRPAITVPAIAPPERSLPVHPTQIYSVIDGLVLCLLLLAYGRFRRRDGEVSALMMTIYPMSRFFIETLRSDEAPVFGTGMSISQNVSLLLLVCAGGVVVLHSSPAERHGVRQQSRATRGERRGTVFSRQARYTAAVWPFSLLTC